MLCVLIRIASFMLKMEKLFLLCQLTWRYKQPSLARGGGRVVRWSWVNFQCRGVLLVLIRVGQGPTALAVGAGGGCLDIFTRIYSFSPLSPSLWEAARCRLKYCLKGPLKPNPPPPPPHWLELPLSRTNFHGPKEVRAIEVRLYMYIVR